MILYLQLTSGSVSMMLAALVIGILTTYVAFEIAERVYSTSARRDALLWTVIGTFTLGSGIWATHCVSTWAALYPVWVGYEPRLTMLSWGAAVFTGLLFMAGARRETLGRARLTIFSGIAGLAATAAHFIGAQAFDLAPEIDTAPWLGITALVALIVASGFVARMFYALRELQGRQRLVRQVMTAAVYGGVLAATSYLGSAPEAPVPTVACDSRSCLDAQLLGAVVAMAAGLCLGLALLIMMLERRADFRARQLDGSLDHLREELHFATFNHPVTGLPNRLVFQDRLTQAVARCDRAGESLAVLFIDLDGFKAVNHSWEGREGEKTLQHVADALTAAARASDTIATVGDDQFLVVMDGIEGLQPAIQVAERLATALRSTFSVGHQAIAVTASIGITIYPADGASSALVANASAAAQAARRDGGNGYRFFETAMNAEAHAKSRWLDDLRGAVVRNELELHYQPKVHAQSGQIAGVEALLRWNHPTCGMVSPAVFIPLAEQFGLIQEVGSWVIEAACRQMRAWCDENIHLRVAINLSVHQIRKPGLADEVMTALARHQVDPGLLTCEITESGAMDNTRATLAVFEKLRQIGVQLSIDDFGTGYSSLSYLRRLPVRQLKIDRSFVTGVDENEDARLVVAAIINLAHALRLEVVAEGVETASQRDVLLTLGCDKFQGYLYAKPMPASLITERARAKSTQDSDFRASVFAMAIGA